MVPHPFQRCALFQLASDTVSPHTRTKLRAYLDVSVNNAVLMEVVESLKDLPCVEANGALIVLQGAPH